MAAKRRIAYVSGSRADFGLMTPILNAIARSRRLALRTYATGMHLMPIFGRTLRDVRKQFPDTRTIPATFLSNGPAAQVIFASRLLGHLRTSFTQERPDLVLTLGDRIEMLTVAVACLYLGIPVGHIHGGDVSATVDDTARHASTKLAAVHFPATPDAGKRIEQMGEEPWRIYVVGAPAIDILTHTALPSRAAVRRTLQLPSRGPFFLITQHPVSEQWQLAAAHIRATIDAVNAFPYHVVIIYPNADPGGRQMIAEIERHRQDPRFHIVPNLEYETFAALERDAAVWIGNSSAGTIESATFRTPVINLGIRQADRLRGQNVLDVGHHRDAIVTAIRRALTDRGFRRRLRRVRNPWGDGRTGPRVAAILEQLPYGPRLLHKRLTYA